MQGSTTSDMAGAAIFWGDRFKSVVVDKGETLINCLAYIDSKRDKSPKPVVGLSGIYSLKRLTG